MRIRDWSSDVCSSDLWGNPEQREFYDYMLSYSPYDNLSAQAYPAMFVGTGLWDSQVQYWEPAKYVAKLRDLDTGDGTIVLRTNMDAGHGGKSGRFRRYRELDEMYAFLPDRLEVRSDERRGGEGWVRQGSIRWSP